MLGVQPVVEVELFDQEITCFLGQRYLSDRPPKSSRILRVPGNMCPLVLLCVVERDQGQLLQDGSLWQVDDAEQKTIKAQKTQAETLTSPSTLCLKERGELSP